MECVVSLVHEARTRLGKFQFVSLFENRTGCKTPFSPLARRGLRRLDNEAHARLHSLDTSTRRHFAAWSIVAACSVHAHMRDEASSLLIEQHQATSGTNRLRSSSTVLQRRTVGRRPRPGGLHFPIHRCRSRPGPAFCPCKRFHGDHGEPSGLLSHPPPRPRARGRA